MLRTVPGLLPGLLELLASAYSTALQMTDETGQPCSEPIYNGELSRLLFAQIKKLHEAAALRLREAEGRAVLIDSSIPGIRAAAVSVHASAREAYTLFCGPIAESESMQSHETERLLQGMERFAQVVTYMAASGRDVPLYRSLADWIAQARLPDDAAAGRMVEAICNMSAHVDFAGYAVSAGPHRYRIVEYSGPNRDEWLHAAFDYGEGFLGQACMLGQARTWKNIEGDPRADYFQRRGLPIHQLFGYPIVADSETPALLFGGSLSGHELGEDFGVFLQILSYLLSMRLRLRKLSMKEQRHNTQLAALVEISKIMNTAADLKKVLYVFVDVSLILINGASSSHLLLQLPGTSKAHIVSRGIKQEQVQHFSKTIVERFFAKGGGVQIDPALEQTADGDYVLSCPIRVASELGGVLSLRLKHSEPYEEMKDIFSTFLVLAGITLERILHSGGPESHSGKAELLHQAAKVWNREAYERGETVKRLALEFADYISMPPQEKARLAAAGPLCIYPVSFLHEQLAGDPLLTIIERFHALKGGSAPPLAEDQSEAGLMLSQILLLVHGYAESGGQPPSANGPVSVDERLRTEFSSFALQKLTVEMEIEMKPGGGEERASLGGGRLDFDRVGNSMNISPRERDVLRLMMKGSNNREIADELFISEHTVKNHVTSLFHKLEVSDRAQAIAKIYSLVGNQS
ncbi:LuxR C-terminal-related transcriptional regulator [Paenibacillus thermotolerans]|uniref:LuxR C-terminal-related transcriptional regulator n=1 Tax=Paenibacillus thermotolerans TaxID=3027807 RepID=UPI002368B373|nr:MULTISPECIES: LuxR C-terminal-related transcriptional regulator [unclassified Paenibacillus]